MPTYVVYFKVFDVQSIKTPDGLPIDPYIVVNCCGQSYQTSTMEGRKQLATWNEAKLWADLELSEEEFASAMITFNLYARNWFTRDTLIGSCTLQLQNVNRRRKPDHLYAKKWMTLRSENNPESKGMLKLTCYVLKPGEAPPSADQQEGADNGGGEENAGGASLEEEDLVNARIGGNIDLSGGQAHHVLVTIQKIEHLADVAGAKPSPFVSVDFAGNSVKTVTTSSANEASINETIRLPAMTPIFEDTIILRLWSYGGYFTTDTLVAQGLLSFSELCNRPLRPRWFNLYGFDDTEIPDPAAAAKETDIQPHAFKGRMLISARTERLASPAELEEARTYPAKGGDEPSQVPAAIFADVFAVHGAHGRQVEVEISVLNMTGRTKCVGVKEVKDAPRRKGHQDAPEGVEEDYSAQVFSFSQSEGRPEAFSFMCPEDPASQPHVVVSVFRRGVLSGRTRLGYQSIPLEKVPQYEMGEPGVPYYLSLLPMPGVSQTGSPLSVLLTVERGRDEATPRHDRKEMKLFDYYLRGYVLMARKINWKPEPQLAVRMSCAGTSRETPVMAGLRPCWFHVIELPVRLRSDNRNNAPTMEPITLTLLDVASSLLTTGKTPIGSTNCKYSRMRHQDALGTWIPFEPALQWIKLYPRGDRSRPAVGELLVCFELLKKKDVDCRKFPSLKPLNMTPAPSLSVLRNSPPGAYLAYMRRATIRFSLLGLRDMRGPASAFGYAGVSKPVVVVRVKNLVLNAGHATWERSFEWRDRKIGADPNKPEDKNKSWHSKAGACFEFLQVSHICCKVPDLAIYDPWVEVQVKEGSAAGTLVGECRLPLGDLLPQWSDDSQESISEEYSELVAKHSGMRAPSHAFYDETQGDPLVLARAARNAELLAKLEDGDVGTFTGPEPEKPELDSSGLPESYTANRALMKAAGTEPRLTVESARLNMKESHGVPRPRRKPLTAFGEKVRKRDGEVEVEGCLEDDDDWEKEFWFKNIPLTLDKPLPPDMKRGQSLSFVKECVGFVKCCMLLTDGWQRDAADKESIRLRQEQRQKQIDALLSQKKPIDSVPPGGSSEEEEEGNGMESVGIDPELRKFAFSEEPPDELPEDHEGPSCMREKFKSKAELPPRLRVRMYFKKGVVIVVKPQGFADPFLEYICGSGTKTTLGNTVQHQTNTPEFYHVEERDIVLPEHGRLQLVVSDYADGEIGSTVIDLEDRWHSTKWRNAFDKRAVPVENRALWTERDQGMGKGSLEMWVEMLDTSLASEVKPSELRKPPATDLELRLVIWTTKDIPNVDGDHTDVQFKVTLTCAEYKGIYPAAQETDVHRNCTNGKATFNWRIVYPNIRMPTKSCSLQIQCYDYNDMTASTLVGELNLDLLKYLEQVARDMDQLCMESMLPLIAGGKAPGGDDQSEAPGDEDEEVINGYVKVQMWVMTQTEAQGKLAGKGREEPNMHPQLITPLEGRGWGDALAAFGLAFSLPDLGLMKAVLPIVILTLAALVVLRQLGLL